MDDGDKLLPLVIGSGRVSTLEAPGDFSPPTTTVNGKQDRGAFLCRPTLLELFPTRAYADAQLDDTAGRARRNFRWRPPLRLSLRARLSRAAPPGTFGFGFWNDPFGFSFGHFGAARKFPAAPQCAWFFHGAPPLDLPLARGVPGSGWKAATLRAQAIPLPLLAPLAAGGLVLASLPVTRRWIFDRARSFYRADEALLPVAPSEWHTYVIDWQPDRVLFLVDGAPVLVSLHPPLPPLGLVLWIDNQYAVASPAKGVGFGVLPLEMKQGLELKDVHIEPAC
jgi:hypothetical protein